jgi:cobalamin-dependent methionine synthase I
MKTYVSIAVLLLVVGCASIGTPVTKNNNQINFPHYSIAVPPDQGWRLLRPNEMNEVAVVTLELGPPLSVKFRMQFIKNDILDERVRSLSAQQVADDYRNMEKRIMIEQGVNKGQYQLSEVMMGEETVGGNRFYTMKYTTSDSAYTQNASLYLYFLRQEKNPYFIVIHYAETMPSGVVISTKFYPEFLETLKSLRINQ